MRKRSIYNNRKMVLGKSYTTGFIFLQIKKIFKILQSTSLVSVLQVLMTPNVTQIVFLLVFLFS